MRLTLIASAFALWTGMPGYTAAQTERPADFNITFRGLAVQFEPVLPPLQQIAGAPKAFYDCYWEFGDGTFSFESRPEHRYADTLQHEALLLATGKYDNGKAPKSRKKPIKPTSARSEGIASLHTKLPAVLSHPMADIGLRAVRNPRAGEELILVLAYANRTPIVQSGSLYLFFNQRAFSKRHFNFLESRMHFGEQAQSEAWSVTPPHHADGWVSSQHLPLPYTARIPYRTLDDLLPELRKEYRENKAWRFNYLQPDELRHLFVSLQSTEDMLVDTQAVIRATAVFVSDDGHVTERFDLEMEILASHDPNYILVTDKKRNFRHVKKDQFTYKVHFQNNGEGPASRVSINCAMPEGLDPASLKVLDMYPRCALCPAADSLQSCMDTTRLDRAVVFTFQRVYLPGSRQPDAQDRDSTKGYVRFSLDAAKGLRKTPMLSHASIIFDKNPPIYTNRTKSSFKPGFSPGVAAGAVWFPDDPESWHPVAGLTVSAYKPYRPFLQGELWLGWGRATEARQTLKQDTFSSFGTSIGANGILDPVIMDSLTRIIREEKQDRPLYFSITPIQIRKNLYDWLGIGAGLQWALRSTQVQSTESGIERKRVYLRNPPDAPLDTPRNQLELIAEDEHPLPIMESVRKDTRSYLTLFGEICLGIVRAGPSVSIRPMYRFNQEPGFTVSIFAGWKF